MALVTPPDHPPPPPQSENDDLDRAILRSLDGILVALDLDEISQDRFRVEVEPDRFDRIFGGQTVAQALAAAATTVDGKEPHSLHAYFVQAGIPGKPVELSVDRIRDGRSMATRHVVVNQGDRTLLTAYVSFHDNPAGTEQADPPPEVAHPDQIPRLQDWARQVAPEHWERSRSWIEQPPPIEMRMNEPPSFLGLPTSDGARSHWMRLPRPVGDDPLLHTALLAYASDYLLLDMVFRSSPTMRGDGGYAAFSLDHALWFHRPVRFDRWHLHTQRTRALTGQRGLVEGTIHDEHGNLVATAVQEVLARPLE